jgi:hypothetical protein
MPHASTFTPRTVAAARSRGHTAPIAPAEAALAALRAVVPEVVVSEPAPQDLELRRALAIVVAAVSWRSGTSCWASIGA